MSKPNLAPIFRELKSIFIWTSDEKQYKRPDDWRVPKLSKDGKLRDDCDGFVMYAHKIIREQYPDKEQVKMFPLFCKTPKEGHLILGIQINNRLQIFDNRQDRIVTLPYLRRREYKEFRKPVKSVSGKWVKV